MRERERERERENLLLGERGVWEKVTSWGDSNRKGREGGGERETRVNQSQAQGQTKGGQQLQVAESECGW